jgi:hypothetical protein
MIIGLRVILQVQEIALLEILSSGIKKTNLVGRQRRKVTTRKPRKNDFQTHRDCRSFSAGR